VIAVTIFVSGLENVSQCQAADIIQAIVSRPKELSYSRSWCIFRNHV